VTLPPALRRKFGLDRMVSPLLIVEEGDRELILRPTWRRLSLLPGIDDALSRHRRPPFPVQI